MSHTLLAVESKGTIPWTKPEDIKFTDASPGQLGRGHDRETLIVWADGSIGKIPSDISPEDLSAIVSINGGEPSFRDPTE